ncbi:MAG: 16S rRNA (adenine(1518)-N(6)/adenine(1519)-N(6))-dimethyltransferase RsmA [Acidimicrobiia bacterium]|nr:16S rRNA (adenine(1518)-N(6)/adenine(1519)-N(6))-dimethyltransferase RsmA [Acidimicrobiia bacterium]MDX2468540.1 16S rRNA (adenine(1518)-N(6)/adenine(1519)-N(6))-dimethyltransferase RsmA [Acidimicrobiia bacterium]
MAQGRNEIKALLDDHGIRPKRSLGQNFLADPNLVNRIVRTAGVASGDLVVEVGAGTGTLTRALAATGAAVIAYEVDSRLIPILEDVLADTDVELRAEDVTTVDLAATFTDGPWTMVANLPYNVGTPLILDTLRKAPAVTRLIVMVQREVADRLVAVPGSKAYGVPSVVAALHADTRLVFTVPPGVFFPVPDVESAVVEMVRKAAPAVADRAIEIAATAFQQRRKMLRRSLSSLAPNPAEVLASAGIDETARPEDLAAAAFVRLAEVMP